MSRREDDKKKLKVTEFKVGRRLIRFFELNTCNPEELERHRKVNCRYVKLCVDKALKIRAFSCRKCPQFKVVEEYYL